MFAEPLSGQPWWEAEVTQLAAAAVETAGTRDRDRGVLESSNRRAEVGADPHSAVPHSGVLSRSPRSRWQCVMKPSQAWPRIRRRSGPSSPRWPRNSYAAASAWARVMYPAARRLDFSQALPSVVRSACRTAGGSAKARSGAGAACPSTPTTGSRRRADSSQASFSQPASWGDFGET
jgi:hypothetical protein